MIIVEGPDGSGKSTFIQNIKARSKKYRALRGGQGGTGADGSCAKTDSGWGGTLEAPIAYAKAIIASQAEGVDALDRFHLSEVVYGPMLRGESGINPTEVKILQRLLLARDIPSVVCLPPFPITKANVATPGRERPAFQTDKFLWSAYSKWASVAFSGKHHALVYDYTRVPDPEPWLLAQYVPGAEILNRAIVGSPCAKYLFVGERSTLPVDLPFFSTRGAAGELNNAVWEAGFRESEMAFVNALDTKGHTNPLTQLPLTVSHVIALGQTARDAVQSQLGRDVGKQTLTGRLKIHQMKHPQFWKRVHARQSNEHVQQLHALRSRAS